MSLVSRVVFRMRKRAANNSRAANKRPFSVSRRAPIVVPCYAAKLPTFRGFRAAPWKTSIRLHLTYYGLRSTVCVLRGVRYTFGMEGTTMALTQGQIFDAADGLRGSGERVTIDAVRAACGGGGSTSTYVKYLKLWRERPTPTPIAKVTDLPEDLRDAGLAMLAQFWLDAEAKTQAGIQAIRDDAQQRIAEAKDWGAELEAQIAEQERALDAAQAEATLTAAALRDSVAHNQHQAADIARLAATNDANVARIADLTAAANRAESRAVAAEGYLADVRAQAEADAKRFDAREHELSNEVTALNDRLRAALVDLESTKDDLKARIATVVVRDAAIADLTDQVAEQGRMLASGAGALEAASAGRQQAELRAEHLAGQVEGLETQLALFSGVTPGVGSPGNQDVGPKVLASHSALARQPQDVAGAPAGGRVGRRKPRPGAKD
jgi:hypothetical protein